MTSFSLASLCVAGKWLRDEHFESHSFPGMSFETELNTYLDFLLVGALFSAGSIKEILTQGSILIWHRAVCHLH